MRPSRYRVAILASFVTLGLLALVGLYLRGPQPPAGALSLGLTTMPGIPVPALGCASALLSPVRVEDVEGVAEFRFVETNAVARLVWPAGYRAWAIDGQAVVVNNFGDPIVREGEQLVNLPANEMDDGTRPICIDPSWTPEVEPLGP